MGPYMCNSLHSSLIRRNWRIENEKSETTGRDSSRISLWGACCSSSKQDRSSSGTGSHIRRPGFHAVSSSAMLENFFYGGDMGAALRCLRGTVNTTKGVWCEKNNTRINIKTKTARPIVKVVSRWNWFVKNLSEFAAKCIKMSWHANFKCKFFGSDSCLYKYDFKGKTVRAHVRSRRKEPLCQKMHWYYLLSHTMSN